MSLCRKAAINPVALSLCRKAAINPIAHSVKSKIAYIRTGNVFLEYAHYKTFCLHIERDLEPRKPAVQTELELVISIPEHVISQKLCAATLGLYCQPSITIYDTSVEGHIVAESHVKTEYATIKELLEEVTLTFSSLQALAVLAIRKQLGTEMRRSAMLLPLPLQLQVAVQCPRECTN